MKKVNKKFNIARSAKLGYQMLINNISDNKYKDNATKQIFC